MGRDMRYLVGASISVFVVTLLAAFHFAMIVDCLKYQRGMARVSWLLPMLIIPVAPAVVYFMVTRQLRARDSLSLQSRMAS